MADESTHDITMELCVWADSREDCNDRLADWIDTLPAWIEVVVWRSSEAVDLADDGRPVARSPLHSWCTTCGWQIGGDHHISDPGFGSWGWEDRRHALPCSSCGRAVPP
jgi:hypothetical protein